MPMPSLHRISLLPLRKSLEKLNLCAVYTTGTLEFIPSWTITLFDTKCKQLPSPSLKSANLKETYDWFWMCLFCCFIGFLPSLECCNRLIFHALRREMEDHLKFSKFKHFLLINSLSKIASYQQTKAETKIKQVST